MITIIDYGMGNLKSLANAFESLGEKVIFATNLRQIESSQKLVFPGVGNFGQAMKNLTKARMNTAIQRSIKKETPFLGICLGLQLLFQISEEAPGIKGFGIFEGRVTKFKKVKTPHIGWNQLEIWQEDGILKNIKNGSFAYFMHSFYVNPADEKIIAAKTNYGIDFCSAIARDRLFGIQFHPEKSGPVGLRILKNFIEIPC